MFREWGFLLTEIWVLLALAALIGLIAGWIIWGRRSTVNVGDGDAARLRADLDACRAKHAEKDAQINDLRAKLAAAPSAGISGASVAAGAGLAGAGLAVSGSGADADYDGDGIIEGEDEGVKPLTLTAPRDGQADDLKMIRGIGPKMEQMCNSLGFWHFEQVANWTTAEVAWVNANLEGFNGRVTRDAWVDQAKILAAGGETEFSKRVDSGEKTY